MVVGWGWDSFVSTYVDSLLHYVDPCISLFSGANIITTSTNTETAKACYDQCKVKHPLLIALQKLAYTADINVFQLPVMEHMLCC